MPLVFNGGARKGYTDKRGYTYVSINGKRTYMHRAVYFYFYGETDLEIDHINRNKLDNRIENLRAATRLENAKNLPIKVNNTSGVCGVNWNKKDKKWHARIWINKKRVFIGGFELIEDAIKARQEYEDLIYKNFTGERK